MANPEKHKRNLMQDWLQEEETPAQAKARGVATRKLPKSGARRATGAAAVAAKPDPALMREPSPAPKDSRVSPANSPDHLRKQQRLAALRASHSTKPGRSAGAGAR